MADELAIVGMRLATIRSSKSQEIVTVFEKIPRIAFIYVRRGMNLSDNKRNYEHDDGRC